MDFCQVKAAFNLFIGSLQSRMPSKLSQIEALRFIDPVLYTGFRKASQKARYIFMSSCNGIQVLILLLKMILIEQ